MCRIKTFRFTQASLIHAPVRYVLSVHAHEHDKYAKPPDQTTYHPQVTFLLLSHGRHQSAWNATLKFSHQDIYNPEHFLTYLTRPLSLQTTSTTKVTISSWRKPTKPLPPPLPLLQVVLQVVRQPSNPTQKNSLYIDVLDAASIREKRKNSIMMSSTTITKPTTRMKTRKKLAEEEEIEEGEVVRYRKLLWSW